MNERRKAAAGETVRMMSRAEGAAYCGIGVTRFTAWARSIGAEKRFGNRVLFDRAVIDSALNSITTVNFKTADSGAVAK